MKIKKVKSLGEYFYPATITDAVKDPAITDANGVIQTQSQINLRLVKLEDDINKILEYINNGTTTGKS